ncbi:hypothetical protein [Parapusillimonas granuli]|uniref:Uncharacterized protein n=1 Tax=Parapusillimonas granuli TaxID=380911 RepID=A0A853FVD8_9BURK|nr:hypothetical protein [Parapusillimonas granuli]MBB5217347.1 hypothetical protein [Parapusillimonas granuli]NYT47692.1 hypothetical protein [Parapusillimonas granuli]
MMPRSPFLQDDLVLGPIVPPEFFDAPDNVKVLLGSLYDDAKNAGRIPPRQLPALLAGIERAVEKMEHDDHQVDAERLADGRLH